MESDRPGGLSTPCWIWHGRFDKDGRPVHRGRTAYQVTHEALIGTRPPNREPHHLCRDKRCVNPWHLQWMTHLDHMRLHGDLKLAENTQCPAGHDYTETNTYHFTRKDGRRERHCRQCRRERHREKHGKGLRTNRTRYNPDGG